MKSAAKTVEVNHAEENAKGWYSTISELVAALEVDYDRLEELRDERADLVSEIQEHSAAFKDDALTDDEHETERKDLDAAMKSLTDWDAENADELRELTAAATIDGDLMENAEAVRERIQESPLSVEVRDDWRSPGDDSGDPVEFEILLSTGGPALRIMGELGEHNEPSRAWLEYQDWGTPWTDYYAGEGSGEVLLTYCQQFYFGE